MRSSTASSRRRAAAASTCAWCATAPTSRSCVSDTGAGLSAGLSAGGIGLANIRERLATAVRRAARRSRSRRTSPRDSAPRIVLCLPSRVPCATVADRFPSMPPPLREVEPPMNRPTALIAEDEPLMRERLKDKLAEVWPELAIVAEAEDGDRRSRCSTSIGRRSRSSTSGCPGVTGLDVAAAIGAECHVVFITAYDQYALQGLRGRRGRLPAEAGRDRPPARRWSSASSASSRARRSTCRALVAQLRSTMQRRRRPHEVDQGGGRQAGAS